MTQHTTAQNLSPNRSLQEIFETVVKTAQDRVSQVEKLARDVYATLGEDLSESSRNEISRSLDVLKSSFTSLHEQAKCPELVLAMTGTTSSGKSTLANFLIGEPVLPAAVQEMSAGLVRVKHSHKRKLTIPQTKGATWETGTWENPTASEVCQRLEAAMMAFHKEENRNRKIEPVVFEIEWPIRLAERKKELGLPEGTQVTIIDLPGLKAVNDERNARVIRENIVNAFCLMAYSAEEVDGLKQEDLLNQVVSQVMALNYEKDEEEKTETNQHQGHVSDLSRMLFLLNRIDVFYKHENADKQLEDFKGNVTDQLRERLKRDLPQREDVVDYLNKIELVQICSEPAFFAVNLDRLWEKPDEQVKIVDKIDDSYKKILPKNEKGKNWFREFFNDLEELRDDPKEYSTDKRRAIIKRLIDDTLKGSRADDFEKRLKASITNKLPDIIISAPCNLYSQKEKALLRTLSELCEDYQVRTQREADEKIEALEKAKTDIQKMLKDLELLFAPIKDDCSQYLHGEIKNLANLWDPLHTHLTKVEEKINKKILANLVVEVPQRIISQTINQLANYVQHLMRGEKDPGPSWPFDRSMVESLNAAVESCRQTQASDMYERGGRLKSRYIDQINTSNKALQALIKAFTETLQAGVNTMLQAVSQDVHQAFSNCADILQQEMREHCRNEEAFKEFPSLVYVFDQQLEFQKPKNIRINETFVPEDIIYIKLKQSLIKCKKVDILPAYSG